MIVGIGDIHGFYPKLESLLPKLEDYGINFESDTFVFLGDYVDGGAYTKEVIDLLLQFQDEYAHWVFLKGNHEDMLLTALMSPDDRGSYYLWWNQGGAATVRSYTQDLSTYERAIANPRDVIYPSHLQFMLERPLAYETDNFIFSHAGLRPGVDLLHQRSFDLLWIRDEFIDSDYDWGKRVIYGHTYTQSPLVRPNKIGIDTLHRGGGKLTAVILDESRPEWYDFVYSD